MSIIHIKSQAEFDAIPVDYSGRILIEFGEPYKRAIVNRKFQYASVEAWGNSSVEAWGNSSVVAWENSNVFAWENSNVVARGNSSVVARGNSSVVAWENSSVEAWGSSNVVARGNSSVEAWGNSSVEAWGSSSVEAWGNSSVEAWGNSSVEAWGSSSVVARENSSVEASGNSQICDCTKSHNITTSANSRVVYNPRSIDEYCEHHQIENDETTVKLYKAVHKRDGHYFSDNDRSFEYVIGGVAVADGLTTDPKESCGYGIHMAYKAWCVDYGRDWDDLAIIEVEAEKAGIIVPVPGCGKVRAAQVKVLREVPLEECGLFGKMLAKKRG